MKQTPARTRFKQHFGHANHYLVTSLVALHHLDKSSIALAPTELHTSWNPRNKSSSIYRTRLFIQQSVLASAVDSIDMYISLLYRKPNYIRDSCLSSALDGANRSVMRKVLAVVQHYSICPVTLALVDVLITWRNNLVHELAENSLCDSTREILENNAKAIAEAYRGLVPDQLARKAEKGDALTFKETASLISAAHHFVELVDVAVIHHLNFSELCCDIVGDALADESLKDGFKNKFFALPIEKRLRFVRNWLMNHHGISDLADSELKASLRIAPNKNVG